MTFALGTNSTAPTTLDKENVDAGLGATAAAAAAADFCSVGATGAFNIGKSSSNADPSAESSSIISFPTTVSSCATATGSFFNATEAGAVTGPGDVAVAGSPSSTKVAASPDPPGSEGANGVANNGGADSVGAGAAGKSNDGGNDSILTMEFKTDDVDVAAYAAYAGENAIPKVFDLLVSEGSLEG